MAVVEYAALPLAFALMPFVVLKMAWTGDAQWPFIFAPLWPIVSVMLLLHIHGWIWPAKTLEARAKKAFPEIFGDTDQPSSQRSAAEARWHKRLVQWIVSPTIWRGAAIDSAGPCNPIDLRYIKDQSYLEARMAAAESNWWSRLWMFIWGITCGYGSNIWLWIGWSLLLALSFGTTYFAGGNRVIVMEAIPGRSMSWYTPFYYSFVTFTTLGFGDVVPMNWAGELIVTVEVILGYVMLGGLVSILANKLARLA